MKCLYLVLVIVVIQETFELNPDILKYNDWIKDAEATVKRIKANEKRRTEYEINKDTYIHDKRETDTDDELDNLLEDLDPVKKEKLQSKWKKVQEKWKNESEAYSRGYAEAKEHYSKTHAEIYAEAKEELNNATEYTKFQCAISGARRNLDQLETERQKFVRHTSYYCPQPGHVFPLRVDKMVRAIIKRLSSPWEWLRAYPNAEKIYCFLRFSPSYLAENIQNFFLNSDLEYYLAAMSATLQGEFYLFNYYIHPTHKTKAASPTVQQYIARRDRREKISFPQLLKELNHWPLRLQDFNYINLLRDCLRPRELFYLNHTRINDDTNPLVMPISEPEYGCPLLIFL